MEQIAGLLEFGKNHWVDILAVIGSLDIVLGIVSKWTPWTWDDNIYSMVHNAVVRLVKKPQ